MTIKICPRVDEWRNVDEEHCGWIPRNNRMLSIARASASLLTFRIFCQRNDFSKSTTLGIVVFFQSFGADPRTLFLHKAKLSCAKSNMQTSNYVSEVRSSGVNICRNLQRCCEWLPNLCSQTGGLDTVFDLIKNIGSRNLVKESSPLHIYQVKSSYRYLWETEWPSESCSGQIANSLKPTMYGLYEFETPGRVLTAPFPRSKWSKIFCRTSLGGGWVLALLLDLVSARRCNICMSRGMRMQKVGTVLWYCLASQSRLESWQVRTSSS